MRNRVGTRRLRTLGKSSRIPLAFAFDSLFIDSRTIFGDVSNVIRLPQSFSTIFIHNLSIACCAAILIHTNLSAFAAKLLLRFSRLTGTRRNAEHFELFEVIFQRNFLNSKRVRGRRRKRRRQSAIVMQMMQQGFVQLQTQSKDDLRFSLIAKKFLFIDNFIAHLMLHTKIS